MSSRYPPPDFTQLHKSLSLELYAVKDRIRNLLRHWQTDGEWKESALRTVLRRHLPQSVTVGRGFVVTEHAASTQIDILIVDNNKPTLLKDGDLMIVTPDAVLAAIEVKTELPDAPGYIEALSKLSDIKLLCRPSRNPDEYEMPKSDIWTGLFVYDGATFRQESRRIETGLRDAYVQTGEPVDCVASGHDVFMRLWRGGSSNAEWGFYDLTGLAPSYFIGNLIDSITTIDHSAAGFAWFPVLGGKEQYRQRTRRVRD